MKENGRKKGNQLNEVIKQKKKYKTGNKTKN